MFWYRVAVGFLLIYLLGQGILWLVQAYFPFSVVVIVMAVLFCVVFVIERGARPQAQKRQLQEQAPQPLPQPLTDQAAADLFVRLLARYPAAIPEDNGGQLLLPFHNTAHGLWCSIDGGEAIVGLAGSGHHEHVDYCSCVDAEDYFEGICYRVDEIISERAVQIIFYDRDGNETKNDLYPQDEAQKKISDTLHSYWKISRWLFVIPRLIFLMRPFPGKRPVLARVFSYAGTYDAEVTQ